MIYFFGKLSRLECSKIDGLFSISAFQLILYNQNKMIAEDYKAMFIKVGQKAPMGAMISKEAKGGSWTVHKPKGDMRSCFETYTRYFRVYDEDQKKVFWVILLNGAIAFLISHSLVEWGLLKKMIGKHC